MGSRLMSGLLIGMLILIAVTYGGDEGCQTGAECADEEAYLLDMDEGRQR